MSDRETSSRVRRALLAVLGAAACTSPSQTVRALDAKLHERAEGLSLAAVSHSTLAGAHQGLRVQIQRSSAHLDDLSLWAALDEQTLGTLVTEDRGAPWTHAPDLPLGSEGPGDSPHLAALTTELQRAHDSAQVVLRARERSDDRGYGIYAEGTTPYRDVVNVMFAAGKADLRFPWLAVRQADDTVGVLPVGVIELCAATREELDALPDHTTGRCEEATVQLRGEAIALRSRHSRHVPDGCLYALSAEPGPSRVKALDQHRPALEAMRKAAEDLDDVEDIWGDSWGKPPASRPPRERPPEPCRRLEVEQVARSAKALHQALDELSPGAEPCRQVNLSPTYDTPWQQVITVFDALHRLGHDRVVLLGGDVFEACDADDDAR